MNHCAALVDGLKDSNRWGSSPHGDESTCESSQWVQVDLLEPMDIDTVVLHGYVDGSRQYCGRKIEISMNGDSWIMVYDMGSEYSPVESNNGTSMVFSTETARFVRVYSSRSTDNTGIHFLELEVHKA